MNALSISLALCLTVGPAAAQAYVYEQPPAPGGGIPRNSQLWIDPTGQNDLDSDAIAWEDFELPQATTITSLRWWGEAAPSLGFRISFHHQDPGTIAVQPDIFAPGSTPISQANYSSYTQTAVAGGLYRFEVQLVAPLTFDANTRYFVSVVGRTPVAYATWNWASSSSGPNGTFWWSRGLHMYFHLGESRAMALATAAGWPVGDPFCFGDGSDATCPCGNAGGAGNGCGNFASPGGAHLLATGNPSITSDTLVLTASNAIPFGPGLFYQGSAPVTPGVVFGNGLRCAGGTTPRLEIRLADGTGGSSTTVPIHVLGSTGSGDLRCYQAWYRDDLSFCTFAGFNFSNALSLTWAP